MSNPRVDFPEPDTPVNTTNLSLGIVRLIFLRLCSRAPRTVISEIICTPGKGVFSPDRCRVAVVDRPTGFPVDYIADTPSPNMTHPSFCKARMSVWSDGFV